MQCFAPYTTITDSWRATSTGSGSHHDDGNGVAGVGGGRWYRFASASGGALGLPLSSPGGYHCGTSQPGWLTGWSGAGDPPSSFSAAGRYPAVAEGVVEMTACFNSGSMLGCGNGHVIVGVVRCGNFLLWRLPYATGLSAYCTAPTGL
eukprot:SAG25_NODE_6682_length_538_cov_1.735763_1_plen_148_part_00